MPGAANNPQPKTADPQTSGLARAFVLTLAGPALADYSARMALRGLTRAARSAGMAHATSAATSISTTTDP